MVYLKTIANKSWTLKPTSDDFIVVRDGADGGVNTFFDVFMIQSLAIIGDSLNNLAPWYIGFSLLSNDPKPNDAIVDTKLPLQLNPDNFSYFAGGSFTFGDFSSFGRFDLDITKITIKEIANVPEPSGLVLTLISVCSLLLINIVKARGCASRSFRS